MKKLLYPLFFALALGFTFVSCDDDDLYTPTPNPVTPETVAAGVYEGTLTRTQTNTGAVETSTGTVTVVADSAYCADIVFDCAGDFSYQAKGVANITYANDGFYFFNNLASGNGLGAIFSGTIDADDNLNTSFTITQRQGFTSVTFKYEFEGKKQQ